MADRSNNPDPYLMEREVLAQNPWGSVLGVDIDIFGKSVMLLGTRTSSECQVAAPDVARDLLPNHHVCNETAVANLPQPAHAEHLP